MKKILYSGVFRNREVKVDEYCDEVYDERADLFVNGVIKQFNLQRYRIGDLVAYKEEGTKKVHIGYAVCAPSDLKFYQKALGKSIALAMADTCYEKEQYVPRKVREDIAYFCLRIRKYFGNDCELPKWAEELYQKYCF